MFKDDQQRAYVCKVLLGSLGMGRYWTEHGPTEEAKDIWMKWKSGPWSHGEKIIWGLAWSLWTGDDDPAIPFGEIIYTLDGDRLKLVGSLVVALHSSSALQKWINLYGPQAPVGSL
jgi:hypothetical protein